MDEKNRGCNIAMIFLKKGTLYNLFLGKKVIGENGVYNFHLKIQKCKNIQKSEAKETGIIMFFVHEYGLKGFFFITMKIITLCML